jgi:hypothetical protein
LFADAVRVFETAVHGGEANLGILVDHQGAIRIVSSDGWRPEALREHYGASEVFQVTHSPAGLRVEARSGGYSCLLTKNGLEVPGAALGRCAARL